MGNGASCLFWRGIGLCDYSAIQLYGSNPTMVDRDHATGILEKPHLQEQGPSERIHDCDPE